MAEQSRVLSAAFPTPPPFYKSFTKDNLSQLKRLRKQSEDTKESFEPFSDGSSIDVLALPQELRCLIPPEPPGDGRFKTFGVQHDLNQPNQSLSEAGIQQLYPAPSSPSELNSHPDPTPHLLTLTRSILLNFLELVGILSVNPAHYAEKIEHLQTLFYNVHDLINQYRPHQARESLILMMEEQLDRFRAEIESVHGSKQKMEVLLKTVQESGVKSQIEGGTELVTNGHGHVNNAQKKQQEYQRRQWAMLHNEVG